MPDVHEPTSTRRMMPVENPNRSLERMLNWKAARSAIPNRGYSTASPSAGHLRKPICTLLLCEETPSLLLPMSEMESYDAGDIFRSA